MWRIMTLAAGGEVDGVVVAVAPLEADDPRRAGGRYTCFVTIESDE